ncbi:sigma 54-interacting transcriptional regulator [Stigmatella sp. ncwal1]|uniref:Sigma 54-interacting transcriptional regulator n=1 Tax=Stigmatella ashevillensis TaxID=2995309 RepID=A0ABT5D0J4_9BACT|nr:sigma 54-interacting transcriptional regulator [Stigmatella ashevillena]MDC0707194.1 sigma 54-interacting transcriptional regulator [Stigmatella ashevillena]
MDFEKYQNLPTIILLREVIRKWWQADLTFANKHGVVLTWQSGEPPLPPNDFCRLSVLAPEGERRCSESLRSLHEKFKGNKRLRQALAQDCHLNFTLVGAPLYLDAEYEGMLFVQGLIRHPLEEHSAQLLKAQLRELVPVASDLDRALARVPVLDTAEMGKLSDLLELAINEILRHEEATARRDEPPAVALPPPPESDPFEKLIGRSGPMLEIFKLVEKVAQSHSTVLINGESGTGKELVARALHHQGPRRDRPFVVQNCSAFNDNLLESALFGHLRGAFTGATRDKKGLFEVADGGTFFLDEVGDMSPALQVKLLRVLQEGTFLPVGGTYPKEVDVRVIAATHKDLAEMVKRGEFREDLYYRINVIRLHLPPLRERREDLPVLIEHFLRKHHREGQRARGLDPEALPLFNAYPWPGNIRELENEIERLLVLGGDREWLPADLISSRIRDAVMPGELSMSALRATGKLPEAVEALEREMIQRGLARTQHNKSRLARELGISRSNLILKIARYGLDRGPDEAEEND